MKKTGLKIFLLCILFLSFPIISFAKDFTIVIDAGHGGKDAGSVDNGIKEKDINLDVALKLSELFKKKMKGVKVVLTRSDDTYLTLQQRADKANSAKGDIFISVHCNSVDMKNPNRKKVNGSSTHVLGLHKDQNNMAVARRENAVIKLESDYQQKYSGFDPGSDESYIIFEMAQKKNLGQSIKLANKIQKQLNKTAGRKDNGVHQNGFWVLWATSMPAVLVELDFICNPESAAFMESKEGQAGLANSIFNAVKEYYSEWKNPALASKEKTDVNEATAAAYPSGEREAVIPEPVFSKRSESRPETKASYSSKRRRRSETARKKSEAQDYAVNEIFVKKNADIVYTGHDNIATAGKAAEKNEAPSDSRHQKSKKPAKEKKASKADVSGKQRSVNGKPVNVLASGNSNSGMTGTGKKASRHAAYKDGKRTHLNRKNYYVRLIVSQQQLPTSDPRLTGLPDVKCVREGDNYTYLCKGGDNLEEARGILARVKDKFSEAVIVSSSN